MYIYQHNKLKNSILKYIFDIGIKLAFWTYLPKYRVVPLIPDISIGTLQQKQKIILIKFASDVNKKVLQQ